MLIINNKYLLELIIIVNIFLLACASTPKAQLNINDIELLSEIQQEGGDRSKTLASNFILTLKAFESKGQRQQGYDWLMSLWATYPFEVWKLRKAFYPEQPQTELDKELRMLAGIHKERGWNNAVYAAKLLTITKAYYKKHGRKVAYDTLMRYGTKSPYEVTKVQEYMFSERAPAHSDHAAGQYTTLSESRTKPVSPPPAPPKIKPVPPKIKPIPTTGKKSKTPEFGKKFALVVGISNYKYAGENDLTDLLYADDDAYDFANALKKLGWQSSHIRVLVNKDATKRNIVIALESWFTKAGPNDLIVVFWSGHGYPDPEDPEKVYFACFDSEINIPATGYRMDRVRLSLEERKTRNVLFFADTCHAGKLITRGERGISVVPHIKKLRREKKLPKGWVFMVGAETDRQALEHSSWSNGAFTHCLIEGISGKADGYESIGPKDGIVTMGELQAYLNSSMPEETQKAFGVSKRPLITTTTGDPSIWDLTLCE